MERYHFERAENGWQGLGILNYTCKLQNFDAYGETCHITFDDRTMKVVDFVHPTTSKKTHAGFYHQVEHGAFGFFYTKSEWYFFVGFVVHKLSEIVGIKRLYGHLGGARLRIGLESGNTLEVEYSTTEKIENDPTPFIDDEDFDFGLFFENTTSNQERLDRILRSQLEA